MGCGPGSSKAFVPENKPMLLALEPLTAFFSLRSTTCLVLKKMYLPCLIAPQCLLVVLFYTLYLPFVNI